MVDSMRCKPRSCARGACAIAVLLLAGACGGDYWLGGRRDGDAVTTRPARDGGSAGTAVGRDAGADGGPPSQTILREDIVLSGEDELTLGSDGGSACRIVGDGHSIRSQGTWTGSLSIRGCTLIGLGSATTAAIELELSDAARATIEDSTLRASGAIHVSTSDESSVTFRGNVVDDDSLVALDPSFDASTPAFLADGSSEAPKVFAGNRIERSLCWFGSPNWLIGGDAPEDGNLVVGLRAGIVLASSGIVVRGNYVHNLRYPDSGDESALAVIYGTSDVLAEHNVLRGGSWVVRGFGGELRYNALLDADGDDWLNQPFEDTKVHHNLFAMCHPPGYAAPSGLYSGVHLVNARARGIEIYNNTLDAGGPDMRLTGPAISIDEDCLLASLRSNALIRFPYRRNDGGAAAVRPGALESVEPPPPRLGYADYNLFFNPDAESIRNYAVAVRDRIVRADAGFALHDAPSGGALDAQVDPQLADLGGDCFAWDDRDILERKVSVARMLAALRAAYGPMPGSPLLDAGDPADGAANMIGAVGDGRHPLDRFGMF